MNPRIPMHVLGGRLAMGVFASARANGAEIQPFSEVAGLRTHPCTFIGTHVRIILQFVGGALTFLLVVRHHAGHHLCEFFLTIFWRRMRTEKFWWALTAHVGHFLP